MAGKKVLYVEYIDEGVECIDPNEYDSYVRYLSKKLKNMKEQGLIKADEVEVVIPICGQVPSSVVKVKAVITLG